MNTHRHTAAIGLFDNGRRISPMFNRVKLSCLGVACAVLAMGCHSSSPSSSSSGDQAAPAKPINAAAPAVAEVTVAQVAGFTKDKSATVFDANDADTRKEYGVVPGAVLLASHKSYPLTVLPPTKSDKLVFYCGGTQCRASDAAAARAASAGYSDVSVMRAGIRGWKEAGMPTSAAPQS
jgi:rhodanese-related sulfurtransferase